MDIDIYTNNDDEFDLGHFRALHMSQFLGTYVGNPSRRKTDKSYKRIRAKNRKQKRKKMRK